MMSSSRRLLTWWSIVGVLLACVVSAGFGMYWFVVWPVSPNWVAETSPWLEPQLRAFAKGRISSDRLYTHVLSTVESYGPAAFPILLKCLQSSDQDLRRESIPFLLPVSDLPIPHELADELIRASVDADPEIARQGCESLRWLPHEWSKPALKQVLAHRLATHYEARTQAMRYLAKQGDRELVPLIIPDLRDPEPAIRISAVFALNVLNDPTADDEVRKLAEDPDSNVRLNVEAYFGK